MSSHNKNDPGLGTIKRSLEYLLNSSPIAIFACTPGEDYRLRFMSLNIFNLVGYSSRDFIDDPGLWLDKIHPDDKGLIASILPEITKKDRLHLEYRFMDNAGNYRWLHDKLTLIRDAKGNPLEIIGYRMDITPRKKAEESLYAERNLFRATIHGLPVSVFVLDENGIFTLSEGTGLDVLGIMPENVLGKLVYDIFQDRIEIIELIKKAFSGESDKITVKMEQYFIQIWTKPVLDQAGKVKSVISLAINVTDQMEMEEKLKKDQVELQQQSREIRANLEKLKTAQEKLIQSEKLASIGTLVSSFAHEINNPLMVILGTAQLFVMEPHNAEKNKKRLELIIDQCTQAKDIIERMLTFSKPSKGKIEPINIIEPLEFVSELVKNHFTSSGIDILIQPAPELPLLEMDMTKIREVFMNIMNNSAEAMPHGGMITITASLDGNNIRIDFTDTGCGMTQDVLKNIFDPFFTTKKTGTGLGLSVTYSIVKAYGGTLEYSSVPGAGTTATLIFPVPGKN